MIVVLGVGKRLHGNEHQYFNSSNVSEKGTLIAHLQSKLLRLVNAMNRVPIATISALPTHTRPGCATLRSLLHRHHHLTR